MIRAPRWAASTVAVEQPGPLSLWDIASYLLYPDIASQQRFLEATYRQ